MLIPTGNGNQNRPFSLPANSLIRSEAVSQPFTLPPIPQQMSYQLHHPPPSVISSAFPILPHHQIRKVLPHPYYTSRMTLPYPYAPFNPYEIPTTQYHTPLSISHFAPNQTSISSMPLNYALSNPTAYNRISSRDHIQMPNTLPYNKDEAC